ncbi:MAG: type II toxin-antitoxin system RelE/ParE family toxin [Ignavibacteria bacterium]|nr:type II toxin-antitoxin system RelE/ParE family toxin [Ignavibacteria bacterium]
MNVVFKESFEKDISQISEGNILREVERVIAHVEEAATPQQIRNLRKLTMLGNYFRIRIRQYRIGITIEHNTVVFVRCLQRKDIYRYFP